MALRMYECEHITLRARRGHLSALCHFSDASGTREAGELGAFVRRRQTRSSYALNQDVSQPFPEGQRAVVAP